MTPLRAIIVCVDYSDLLAVTLAYNRHHFSEVMIVTTPRDLSTVHVGLQNNARVHMTGAFYADGAVFNKFKALEEGLDEFGRHGWLCIMDADVLWPKEIDWDFYPNPYAEYKRGLHPVFEGYLYTPLRRMCEDLSTGIPQEPYWKSYPLHPQQVEWAGYTQIFHAEDHHLPANPPWHQTNWRHAGGADSFFQQLWPKHEKLRPPFECLHLGPAGRNWCGRSTPYLDGTIDPLAEQRISSLRNFMTQRTRSKSFDSEKL